MQHAKERQRDRPEADRHGAFPGEPAVSELKCALVYPLPFKALLHFCIYECTPHLRAVRSASQTPAERAAP